MWGLTPLGLSSLCLLHLPSLGLLVILPLTPFGLLLVYPITLSMASWILGCGFMITCSVMPIWFVWVYFSIFQYNWVYKSLSDITVNQTIVS